MRKLIVLLCLLLNGCFFVYLPGQAIGSLEDSITGSFGNMCVPETAKIGDRLKQADGRTGTVERISGPSSRCNGPYPIRAQVQFDQT